MGTGRSPFPGAGGLWAHEAPIVYLKAFLALTLWGHSGGRGHGHGAWTPAPKEGWEMWSSGRERGAERGFLQSAEGVSSRKQCIRTGGVEKASERR